MKKRIMAIFLVTTMLVGLVGCGTKESGKTKVVLNEVAHSIFYAPLYVAIENHYFDEVGIDLDLVTGFGADKTMTALLSGEADIGFMGPETTIYTYVGGNTDPVVNFAQLTQRAGNFLVSRTNMDSFKWTDLKGTTVLGGRAGGMPELVFEYVLKINNMNPTTDLTIDQSIDFGSTAAAFSGGQGDFSVEFEPHASALERKGDGYIVASLGEESGYVPYTSFSAKRSYLEENHEIVEAFVKAIKQGMDYVDTHEAKEIAEVIAPQFSDTDLTLIETIIERYKKQDTWKSNLVFEEESFTLLQNILEEGNVLEERVPYEEIVTTEFVQ